MIARRGPPKSAELAKIIDLRVARRIREKRLSIGMTQHKLAQIIGVAFQQAHKYERGPSRTSAGPLLPHGAQGPDRQFLHSR